MPPLEDALLHEFGFEAVFAEDEADEARMGAERVMIKLQHDLSGGARSGEAPVEREGRPDRRTGSEWRKGYSALAGMAR